MDTPKITSALSEKRDLLKKFKIQVYNAHVTYLIEYEMEFRSKTSNYNPNHQSELTDEIEENYLYMSISAANAVLSDIGIEIDTTEFSKRYFQDGDEHYALYPYASIWECMETINEIDFFIATLSLVLNVENFRELGKFYNSTILRLIKDSGFEYIYDMVLKKNSVFIAMWFNNEMFEARVKIEKAIKECGYNPIIIDQKEYNNQIVPEIFHEIKECSFVVADLTGQRNGVYYEAGYAEAIGKPVILTCRKSNKKPHFDVAQKNTIFWDDTNDLYSRLLARIISTCPVY